ncbi:O-Antigen ligase [compost metagenome]
MKVWKLSTSAECLKGGRWSVVMVWALSIGLFIQISGKVWMTSGSGRNAQVYIWLLLPALIFSLYKLIVRNGSRPDLQYLPWIIFLSWVAMSTLWATGSDASAHTLAKRCLFIGLYLVAINLLLNRHEVFFRRALLASVLVVAIGAMVSLTYQYGVLDKPMAYRAFRIDRMGVGNFANYGWPVAAGIFNGAIAIWAIGMALDKKTNKWAGLAWLMVFVVLAAYVVMTGTRGAWFALLGGCMFAVVMQKSKRGIWGFGLCALVSLVVVFLLWDQILTEVLRRQLSGRGPIWAYYFDIMSGHWLFGHGLGTPFEYLWPNGKMISPHAHSLYLQQIYDSGIISFLFLVTGLLGICYKAWCLRNNSWVRLAFPALVFAFIAMLTDVERIITRPGDYWTVFWLPVAVLLAVQNQTKKSG